MTTNDDNPNRLTREAMIARVSDLAVNMMAIFDTDEYADLVNDIILAEHPELDLAQLADDDDLGGLSSDVENRIASALFLELHRLLFIR